MTIAKRVELRAQFNAPLKREAWVDITSHFYYLSYTRQGFNVVVDFSAWNFWQKVQISFILEKWNLERRARRKWTDRASSFPKKYRILLEKE